jgi:Lon protease-like protein
VSDPHELIPLFPLSGVVLFPRVKTPLHLFEPRYRQLAADVLAGERRIGMATVLPDHLGEIGGDPPLASIGCCGVVTESQRLPDDTYNIVLLGEQRFRLVAEQARSPDRLYRIGKIERLEDPNPPEDRERVSRLRANIVENVGTLVRQTEPERAAMLDPALFRGVDDATFVNVLANALAFPPEEKQRLLEAESILERYARLAGALSFWRADLEADGESGADPIH